LPDEVVTDPGGIPSGAIREPVGSPALPAACTYWQTPDFPGLIRYNAMRVNPVP
jgi:hypothetical protein